MTHVCMHRLMYVHPHVYVRSMNILYIYISKEVTNISSTVSSTDPKPPPKSSRWTGQPPTSFHAWWNRLKSYHLLADPGGFLLRRWGGGGKNGWKKV